MFCGECGTQNPDTNQFCKECGKPLKKLQPSGAQAPTAPVPVATYPQTAPAPVAAGKPAPVKPPLNKGLLGLCILSILTGGVSWFRYPYLCGMLAIVLGGVVLYKSKNKRSKTTILGILGIIIGLASIIVDIFYLTIFPPVAFVM